MPLLRITPTTLFVDDETDAITVSLSDAFESLDIEKCLSKVSTDLGLASQTETPASTQIAHHILSTFNQHQAAPLQLSRERAHARASPDSYCGAVVASNQKDEDTAFVDDVESKSTESKSTFGEVSSPQMTAASLSPVEDVRSLLYDDSDCDEIEELVFREAGCGLRSDDACDYCHAQEVGPNVNAWSAHRHIADAFGDNNALLSLAIVSSTAVKYNPYGGAGCAVPRERPNTL